MPKSFDPLFYMGCDPPSTPLLQRWFNSAAVASMAWVSNHSTSFMWTQVLIYMPYINGVNKMDPKHDDVIKWKHFPRNWPFLRGIPGEFHTQRPVTRSFDVFFDLRPNKRLSKQSWGWWFETLSCSWWRHRNGCNISGQVVSLTVDGEKRGELVRYDTMFVAQQSCLRDLEK